MRARQAMIACKCSSLGPVGNVVTGVDCSTVDAGSEVTIDSSTDSTLIALCDVQHLAEHN